MATFKLTRSEPKEADIQSAILRALRIHPAVVWFNRMNSGAVTLGEGKSRRFIRYGFKGCPDIHGMLISGVPLYIEVKRPSGRVDPDQRAFLEKAAKFGAVAFVARSVTDVIDVLDQLQKQTAGSQVR